MFVFTKKKKTVSVLRVIVTVAGALALVSAAFAAFVFIKKRAEKVKQIESELESEIEAIVEEKFAKLDAEEAVGVEQCH